MTFKLYGKTYLISFEINSDYITISETETSQYGNISIPSVIRRYSSEQIFNANITGSSKEAARWLFEKEMKWNEEMSAIINDRD